MTSAFDFSKMNETDVRELIVRPLIQRLFGMVFCNLKIDDPSHNGE